MANPKKHSQSFPVIHLLDSFLGQSFTVKILIYDP